MSAPDQSGRCDKAALAIHIALGLTSLVASDDATPIGMEGVQHEVA